MTNTKFRKRALLSSVAMLLVALVALGSATFAWFVANPTVTASGLVMKTTAAPGLTVASESAKAVSADNAFGYSTVLDARSYDTTTGFAGPAAGAQDNLILDPASFDTSVSTVVETGTGYSVGKIAAADSGNQKKADGAYNEVTYFGPRFVAANGGSISTGTGVYKEKVYVKTSANAAESDKVYVKALKVSFTQANDSNTNIATGVRVAVTDKNNKLLGVWAPSNAQATQYTGEQAASKKCFDSSKTDGSYKTATFLTSGDTVKSTDDTDAKAIMEVTNSSTDNYFNVYVYLDGEDKNVFTDNVTANITALLSNVEVKISTAWTNL